MTARPAQEQVLAAHDESGLTIATNVVAGAFYGLQATEWLVEKEQERTRRLQAVFRIDIEHAEQHGQVQLLDRARVDDGSRDAGIGAAVWVDRTGDVAQPPNFEARLRAAAGPYADRFLHLGELLDKHHPTDPHHHLAFLAAVPQGMGIGSSLLRHHHAYLDVHGIAAYLEASSPESAKLYQRWGYRPVGSPFDLPNGALFYPMWRDPKAGDPA